MSKDISSEAIAAFSEWVTQLTLDTVMEAEEAGDISDDQGVDLVMRWLRKLLAASEARGLEPSAASRERYAKLEREFGKGSA